MEVWTGMPRGNVRMCRGLQLEPSLANGTQPFLHGDHHERTIVAERSLQPPREERWVVERLQ